MTDRTRLVLRADGGPGIGSGHLARCLALAQAWAQGGAEAVLVSDAVPAPWAERYRSDGIEVRTPADPGWADGAAWVVLDGYQFGPTVQEQAKSRAGRLLVTDDHGTVGRYVADLILDQNLGVLPKAYEQRPEGTELLLGTRYALLRREFKPWRDWKRTVPPVAERVLVSLGGSPSRAVARTLQEAIERSDLGPLHTCLLDGVDDVAAAMADADLAVAASGTTCWELCFMGLPAVLMATAPNQVPLARALAEHGAASDGGWLDEDLPDGLVEAVARLALDPERRLWMAETGKALVDGRGADRVVARLRSELLKLRPVTMGDARRLWEWANEPAVRRTAFSGGQIPWETHVSWLGTRLSDPAVHLYLASLASLASGPDGGAVGQVRFEPLDGGDVEISVSVAAGQRGKGWGAALVDAGVRRVFSEGAAARVVARIKADNVESVAAFRDAAFDYDGEGDDGTMAWLQYSRPRDERAPRVAG